MALSQRSKQVRIETLRLSKANGGYHYSGCFSAVEILIALFDHVLAYGDRFILSKGHACWPYYVLLRERGYDPELLGHPSRDPKNGVDCTTGSGGHGLPMGLGMAMAKRLKGEPGKVYVLMGDGECQEGTTWESLLIAAHHKVDNLVVIVDWNDCQGSGFIKDILPIPSFCDIAEQIGWNVARNVDGHRCEDILEALGQFPFSPKPSLLRALTVKGKGISWMENRPEWHAQWIDDEHEEKALRELL